MVKLKQYGFSNPTSWLYMSPNGVMHKITFAYSHKPTILSEFADNLNG